MYKALCGLVLLAPVALAACGKGVGIAGAPDSLRYTVRSVEKSDGECRSTDSSHTPAPCVKVSITWPQLADSAGGAGEAQRFVRRLASASFRNGDDKGSPDSVAAEAIAAHQEMRTKHSAYDVPWTAERQITVACNEPGHFGVKVYTHQFTGGLHAMSATRFANFDMQTGKHWGLKDLIVAGQEHEFKEATLAAYRKTRKLPQIKIDVDSFPEPASVLACGDSVVLQYEMLTMGPHRLMGSSFAVKRADLKGIVQP